MFLRLFLCFIIVLSFSGCFTTTQQNAESVYYLPKIQRRIVAIEGELQEKDREIDELKDIVEELRVKAGVSKKEELPKKDKVSIEKPTVVEVSTSYESFKKEPTKKGIVLVTASLKDIQKALQNAGYYYGTIDGNIGTQTKQAIKDFQSDHGLKSDGIVGKKTWSQLESYLY
ncbi:MAG: peptidoglycan-binding domain-containing protein [Candidatus Zapsychrus exili]|nr:peptidoglycan-binding domain-containing protein [Candidatus Zapsychrus exili]